MQMSERKNWYTIELKIKYKHSKVMIKLINQINNRNIDYMK